MSQNNRPKVHCPNMNHGKVNPPVAYCPNCGEHFKSSARHSCSQDLHRERRKSRNFFCCDCGKDLRAKGI